MSTTLAPFAALIVSVIAATPGLGTSKAFGGALTSHSGVGLWEFTLDDACNAAECLAEATATGAVADSQVFVEHVSDTVKRVHTLAAGVAADTVTFCAKFSRMPAGH